MGLFNFFKKKPDIPAEALSWWVHRRSQFEHLAALSKARGVEPFKFLPLGDVFAATPALRTQEGPIPLSAALLERLGMDFEQAVKTAMANSQRVVQQAAISEGVMIWEGHGAEAALLAGALLRKAAQSKGELVMMCPVEGLVLAADAHDERALEHMLELAEKSYASSDEFRSLRAVAFVDENIPGEWLPPEDHPLDVRFCVARARTLIMELKGEHQIFSKDAAPLAHLAALESHGGVLAAAWARGTDVVVPGMADRLILFDTPDQPMSRVDIDFDLLAAYFPEALEPLPRDPQDETEEPALYRLRGVLFPTPRTRTFLLQRDAFVSQSPDAEEREVPAEDLLADFDGGASVLVKVVDSTAIELHSPDGRVATVTPAQFGARVEKLPPLDQEHYYQAFKVSLLMQLMNAALSGEKDLESVEAGEPPVAPEGLTERVLASQPAVLVSNDVRKAREELEKEEKDDGMKALILARVESWEPAQLFPVVRPPGYEEGANANMLGMAQGMSGDTIEVINGTRSASRPGPEGLRLDLVSDRGDRMMVFDTNSQSDDFVEMAWRTALLNLDAASLQPMRREAEGRYVGPWHDDYDFSRVLLLPKLVTACKVKGAPLVFAPTLGRVWVTGADDREGIEAVLEAIDAHFASGDATSAYQFRQLLFGWPWTAKDGALVRFQVPAEHPLAARIEKLDASLARRREQSRAHIAEFAKAAVRGGGVTESEA